MLNILNGMICISQAVVGETECPVDRLCYDGGIAMFVLQDFALQIINKLVAISHRYIVDLFN